MKIVTIKMELIIDDELCEMARGNPIKIYNKNCIADYLNTKLYDDPEFFGDFGPENIESVREFE